MTNPALVERADGGQACQDPEAPKDLGPDKPAVSSSNEPENPSLNNQAVIIKPEAAKVGGIRSSAGTPHNTGARSSVNYKEEIAVMHFSSSVEYLNVEKDIRYMEMRKSD